MEEYKFITLRGCKLFVMKTGLIYRKLKGGKFKQLKNVDNNRGYNLIKLNNKTFYRHRIMANIFLNFNLNEKVLQIDHIDGDKLNNNIQNLRIVSQQQNQMNKKSTKGYSWRKDNNKWQARIGLNKKHINLGCFNTEEEARQAYLNAKLIYHKIE